MLKLLTTVWVKQFYREKAKRAETWTKLEKIFEDGEIVTGVISGKVKGGFTVDIGPVRAFLPGSLVDTRLSVTQLTLKVKS